MVIDSTTKLETVGLPHINEVKQEYATQLGIPYAQDLETSDARAIEWTMEYLTKKLGTALGVQQENTPS